MNSSISQITLDSAQRQLATDQVSKAIRPQSESLSIILDWIDEKLCTKWHLSLSVCRARRMVHYLQWEVTAAVTMVIHQLPCWVMRLQTPPAAMQICCCSRLSFATLRHTPRMGRPLQVVNSSIIIRKELMASSRDQNVRIHRATTIRDSLMDISLEGSSRPRRNHRQRQLRRRSPKQQLPWDWRRRPLCSPWSRLSLPLDRSSYETPLLMGSRSLPA